MRPIFEGRVKSTPCRQPCEKQIQTLPLRSGARGSLQPGRVQPPPAACALALGAWLRRPRPQRALCPKAAPAPAWRRLLRSLRSRQVLPGDRERASPGKPRPGAAGGGALSPQGRWGRRGTRRGWAGAGELARRPCALAGFQRRSKEKMGFPGTQLGWPPGSPCWDPHTRNRLSPVMTSPASVRLNPQRAEGLSLSRGRGGSGGTSAQGAEGFGGRPRSCAVPSNVGGLGAPWAPPWKPGMGRSEDASSGREGVREKGILPQDSASPLPPHWPLGLSARDSAMRLFALALALALAQPFPWPNPNSTPPAKPAPPGRPDCPWSSPVLRKPRHTGAGRPEHPRGRGARVTAGGPPGPCLSRAGGEAARLPSSARRAGSLLFASPRGFPESTPRPTPTLPCPTPGRRGAGPSQGTLAARSALSPPRASSSRFGPGGHASPTPAGRAAAAQCARLRDRVFLVPEAVRGPGAGGEAGSARRAAAHSPCPERSS